MVVVTHAHVLNAYTQQGKGCATSNYLHKKAVDDVGALGLRTLAEVIVEDLATAHANVLALREGLAHIDLAVGG